MNQGGLVLKSKEWAGSGVQDLILDLVSALSALKSLSEISCEMADEKAVIRRALSGLLHNQDMERCSFFIVDSDGMLTNVTGLSIVDAPEEDVSWTAKPLHFRMGEGIIGIAATTGEIQHSHNCAEDYRFSQAGDQAYTPGSIICAPVYTLHNVLIGVLNVSHPQPNFFSDWHVRLLEVYTNILGQLITNRRLFQQMESQIVFRTAELERLVEETRQLKDHYASMSMHDQLTGLHNRRYFYDQVELALAQHKRYKYPFCLLIMDIDHFKAINDRFGHIFGDKVLVSVAQTLKNEVRSTDILVRFGGEEFVVIFANTCCDNGKTFAERIRQQIKALSWDVDNENVQLTLSIGLYCVSPDCSETEQNLGIDQIIHYADTALYEAKAKGRDRVEVSGVCLPKD
ncbi:sensor domain-containing diguanylate cyclase [Methylomonas sp. LL1]|uniref:sensor domain-containing diguanylate cyclase n=1 Tax=Methylomonas sp. LL1 TaxID=2785785 RepID=UPI0018C43526|nr:sensor domain-containing diguanylate cyclase [Methylomonas sp. LL1]QPK63276.1 sensor domain-containing diguanylate cyclase [Methylomonas sp. LL1]